MNKISAGEHAAVVAVLREEIRGLEANAMHAVKQKIDIDHLYDKARGDANNKKQYIADSHYNQGFFDAVALIKSRLER